jgi:hypothetical protein
MPKIRSKCSIPLMVYGTNDWDYLIEHNEDWYIWLSNQAISVGVITTPERLYKHLKHGGILLSFPARSDAVNILKWYKTMHPGTQQTIETWRIVSEEMTEYGKKVKHARHNPAV